MILSKQTESIRRFLRTVKLTIIVLLSIAMIKNVNATTRAMPLYVEYYISNLQDSIESVDLFTRTFEYCVEQFGDKCADSAKDLMLAGKKVDYWEKRISVFTLPKIKSGYFSSLYNPEVTIHRAVSQETIFLKVKLAFDVDFLARYGAVIDKCSYHNLQKSIDYFEDLVLQQYWSLDPSSVMLTKSEIVQRRAMYEKLLRNARYRNSCVKMQHFGQLIAAILYEQIRPYENRSNLIEEHTDRQRFVEGAVSAWVILANMELISGNKKFAEFLKPMR
ncbi:MAG TPA: hypothetical protein VG962_10245 [Steroidobacteraceae bacterium]|nr:hypothetical protein [Steroidobacteraceae bacterium]